MKLEIKTPDLMAVEAKSYMVLGRLTEGNIEQAKKEVDELIDMIAEQRRIIHSEYKDLFFTIANKF